MLPDIPESARRIALQTALGTLLLLTLAGVVWLGIAAERANATLSALTNRLDALALAAPGPGTAAEADQLAGLANDVAALAKKIDTLATEETKAAAAETKGRMVVQVGAFADASKADETRRKLEGAGLKTYIQAVDTKDGKRIRVRVGPFDGKAEAEKAAARIKGLNLPVSILLL